VDWATDEGRRGVNLQSNIGGFPLNSCASCRKLSEQAMTRETGFDYGRVRFFYSKDRATPAPCPLLGPSSTNNGVLGGREIHSHRNRNDMKFLAFLRTTAVAPRRGERARKTRGHPD